MSTLFFTLAAISAMGMFCTALVGQCEMMEGFEPEAPKSNKGKTIWILVAILGHVPGMSEHCSEVWKECPSVRQKFYWAAGWLIAQMLFVCLSILSGVYGW